MSPLPKFDTPPVIETVLGVQSAPLPNFVAAHAGIFWKEYLGREWTGINEVPRLDDAFERFGDERKWGFRQGLRFVPGMEPPRVQVIRDDGERMVQIQSTRFVYNWRKQKGHYPTYEILLPEFKDRLEQFVDFLREAGFGEPAFNQWEVTYVNHIPRGQLWDSPSDWADLFPGFYMPGERLDDQRLESFTGEWHLTLGETRGRLHISLNHARLGSAQGSEGLVLQFTARGPVDVARGFEVESGFDLGHESIVRTFDAITSDKAHEIWKKRG